MAEEEKKEEPKKEIGETLKKALKIALGIIFIGLGIWEIVACWDAVWTVIKGCAGIFLILAGAICFLIAAE
jgi:hypothetical protein